MKQLKKTDFVVTFLKCMDSTNVLVDTLNAMISDITLGVFNNVIKPEHVDKILKFTLVDEIAEFTGSLDAGLAGSITGEEITKRVYNLFKDLHGIDKLFDAYYNAADTTKLMTKDELKTYSKVDTGVKGYESADIQRSLDAYKKQMRVGEQLQLIITYAKENNLVADIVTYNGLKDINENGYQVPATNKVIAEPFIQYLQELSINWSQTMSAHRTMQEYHKYFITYAVRMNSTENASKTFKFIVNNHAYESTLTMPTAKLTEYVLGGTYLDYLGFETAYVNKNYTGFFDIDYNGADHIERPQPNTDEVTFNSITDLLNNIAKTTMQSYYLSNLKKVTKSNLDNIKLKERTFSGAQYQYLQLVLDSVKEYLAEEDDNGEIKYDLFNNLTKSGTCDNFDNVIGYLTGAKKEYASMTAKDFRLELMQAIIDYQPDSASTEKQNQKRFLALFYVYCSDFVEQTGQKYVNIGDNYVEFDENNSDHLPLKKFLFNADGTAEEASVLYMLDTTTKGLIMELAGIKDHPDEMLVGLEYEDVGKYFEGYDENNGDYFIVCTFDEDSQMYIPFMMNSGSTLSAYKKVDAIVDGKTTQISWTDLGYGIARTDYYCYYDKDVTSGKLKLVDKAFPIIAKGIITPDGMPTAIRQINGVTEFYRDNLIIRNASELNLSAYYMSTENLSVNYNFFSMITNTVSKVFTGKTLVEHAYGNIPRFSIDSHIRLPIGVDDEVISLTNEAISANYNFRNLSGLSTQHFYKIIDINFLMMVIAIIALFPLIIKAIYGVFGRIVDITVYYCMSPVMMSTIALGKNADKGKEVTPIYSEWMKKLTQKTLSVFGYVFGFQVFFIIVPFLAGIDFISQDAFNGLLTLNKMMPFLADWGYIVINRFVNLLFVICSAYLITEAPNIIGEVLGQSNGFKDGESLKGNIKATVNEVKEVVNGTRAVNAINYAKESLKENLGVNTIQDIGGRIKKTGAKISAKASEMRLRANGISKQEAKKVTKAMYQAVEDEVNNKKMLRDEVKYKAFDAYHQQIGMGGDTHTKELQEIDQKLYEAGLRNRTEKQQKAVQSQYSKRRKDEEEEKKKTKKEKGKKK